MSDGLIQSLDLSRFHRAMQKVHEQVANDHRRVEFTRPGSDEVCVFLSKAELESLEHALEIFSQTSEYKSMCDHISKLAMECGPFATPAE